MNLFPKQTDSQTQKTNLWLSKRKQGRNKFTNYLWLDSYTLLCEKHVKPVHPKGDQSWVFIGRTDAEAETPMLWPPDAKS